MRKLCRVLFSRYAISALVILLYFVVVALLVVYSAASYVYFAVASLAFDILIILSLVNRETNPEFKVTWLIIVTLLPIFGGILYIIFYSRRTSHKEAKKLGEITDTLAHFEEGDDGSDPASLCELDELSAISRPYAGQALSLLRLDKLSSLYRGSNLKYYPSGDEMFLDMKEAMRSATRYIFLEYFIVAEGVMWQEIFDILTERQRAGVEIRMLYDDIGSMSTVSASFDREMRSLGIECYRFARVTPKVTSLHNNRDHRKILIVDGRIAFTGGVNIADEYIGALERFGRWKDGGVRISGDAAKGFVRQFLQLYDFTAGSISDYADYLVAERAGAASETAVPRDVGDNTAEGVSVSEDNGDGGFYIPFGSGPYPVYERAVGKCIITDVINRSVEYLYITTPYLVIDYDLTEALRSAALRGVDVRIITPGVPDKRLVKLMTKGSYRTLIASGVRIFEYTPGFIHEKMILCDGELAIIGTINLDYRSLVHHYENALWIYRSRELKSIRRGFMSSLRQSREIDKDEAKLKIHERIVRYLVRIFAPLL
ncbi:MAG: PLDc N-terminal domain-containing protein [Clostridia bacterium]|nr:PLDc N-terminal domain-containing protein [Clostridia bacterium]